MHSPAAPWFCQSRPSRVGGREVAPRCRPPLSAFFREGASACEAGSRTCPPSSLLSLPPASSHHPAPASTDHLLSVHVCVCARVCVCVCVFGGPHDTFPSSRSSKKTDLDSSSPLSSKASSCHPMKSNASLLVPVTPERSSPSLPHPPASVLHEHL